MRRHLHARSLNTSLLARSVVICILHMLIWFPYTQASIRYKIHNYLLESCQACTITHCHNYGNLAMFPNTDKGSSHQCVAMKPPTMIVDAGSDNF